LNIAAAGDSYTGKFYLEYYQTLPEGQYRLVKEIECIDGEHGSVSFEFTVN
jgi:hypothetical protein